MAGDSVPDAALKGKTTPARETLPREKPATPWLIPVVTATILISAFCLYYFVYVAAQREYLANRNFRSLAGLGGQVQTMVSIHGSILEFYADLADEARNPTARRKQNKSQFLVVRSEDELKNEDVRAQETRKDYLKYLAPNFELTEISAESKGRVAKPPARLDVQRRNGRWELMLTAQRHQSTGKDYVGTLDLENVMKPLVSSLPFDDILLISQKGTVVYQSNKAGPQFVTLNHLLQAQPGKPAVAQAGQESGSTDGESGGSSGTVNGNTDRKWRNNPMHMADVAIAGTPYKLFLQPVLVDVFSDEPDHTEPASEWVLCGLRSSKALEWEALSISSTFIIWFTALFLAISMSGSILKVLFMNRRERLRLRELGFLGLFLVLLASVFTLTGLQVVGYPLNDDTEAQLQLLGNTLSTNVHSELQQMRDQLMAWCATSALHKDMKLAGDKNLEITRNARGIEDKVTGEVRAQTPEAKIYPFLNNAFWTDDDGNQIVKWSTGAYLTPMIDVSRQDMYTHAKGTYLDGKAPPFHFDSSLPPNKLEYLSALTIRTEDCMPMPKPQPRKDRIREDLTTGSAFVTAQPLSLIDPILPFGYGFALLDEKGVVLFHSEKTRNLRENFLQESDGSRQLYAAAFGHSSPRSLGIKYLGKDYKARVIPIAGVSQAPWTLIVYRDLTSVRTLNLQAMTMASTLLLFILLPPTIAVIIWCAARRPRFAPEWVWPNRERSANYIFLTLIYAGLIVAFLVLGFTGPPEQSLLACAVVPYTALLLTVWSFRAWSPGSRKQLTGRTGKNRVGPAAILTGGIICFTVAVWLRVHLPAFMYLSGFAIVASVSLLDRPRRVLTIRLRRSFIAAAGIQKKAGGAGQNSRVWRKYYVLSLALLLFLIGVLTPMALFRTSLNVERRLAVKQAQLHLASALGQRLMTTKEQCEKGELGDAACAEFEKPGSTVWSRIVFDPLFPADGKLPVCAHSACPGGGGEKYTEGLQKIVYALHHDYNDAAAEMLGVLRDRGVAKPAEVKPESVKLDGTKSRDVFPDWSWENDEAKMTLRWHGVHLPGQDHQTEENDLLIPSGKMDSSWRSALGGAAVAVSVMLVIGFLLWTLARRIFLFHVEPLRMTGERKAIDAIRDGINVVVLIPPGSDWHPEGQNWRIDLAEVAKGPDWAETIDLDPAPFQAPIEIHHFEYSSSDGEIDNQKFVLLERLLKRENTQVVVILALAPSPEDPRRLFPSFEVVDLREEPFYWLKQYEGPARDLIWKECGPMAVLWPIGAQLARDIRGDDTHSKETIASEVLERADAYYRLVWKECSSDQKFALAQLAEDGLLNPANARAIRQLVRLGFITTDPQFRLMNESFRRFVRAAASTGLQREWLRDSRRSGWGKVHGAFVTTMIILGAFLLTTQNALWESSAAYVTTALGALGTLTRLFNTWRNGAIETEKAG